MSQIFQRAIQTGQNHDVQYSINIAGGLRWFMLRVAPTVDAAGGAATLCLSSRDNTERVKHGEKLRQSEALLAHAEEIATLGSWEYDLGTKKVTPSAQLLQMYGIASEAEWSEDKYWERIHPDDHEQARAIVNRAFAECKPFEYVSRFFDPGFKVRVHFLRGLPIRGPDGKTARAIGIVQDITERAQAEEDMRRLSQQLLSARDEFSRHVARILHESAGQSLAALKMTLARLRDALPGEDRDVGQLLQSASALADAAIREVRTVSYLMHPPLLDEAGLGPALRLYAQGYSQRSGIAVAVEASDDFGRYSQETEIAVFRIVQEALTNVHRHSGSPSATIRIARREHQIVAEVKDQGCGLPSAGQGRTQQALYGVGIAGMRERVKHLDGSFEILGAPGQGVTVRVVLPDSPRKAPVRLSASDWSV